jgi:septal ring factor EnvC (AmiA/AmiB activator)
VALEKNRADLIREHGEAISSLNQRVDNLSRDQNRLETSIGDVSRALTEFGERIAVLEESRSSAEKVSRDRREYVAILVAVLSLLVSIVSLIRR